MKKIVFFAVFMFVGMIYCSHAFDINSVDLPKDVAIVPPDPNLPPEIKLFSGKWAGKWRDISDAKLRTAELEAVIIVENIINEREAIVIHCWGDSYDWYNTKKGCIDRQKAEFIRNDNETILTFNTSNRLGTKGKFRIKDDKMHGGTRSFITLERIK